MFVVFETTSQGGLELPSLRVSLGRVGVVRALPYLNLTHPRFSFFPFFLKTGFLYIALDALELAV